MSVSASDAAEWWRAKQNVRLSKAASWVVNALVDATPISAPAWVR